MQESCTPSEETYPDSVHDGHTIPRPPWRDPHALKGDWVSPILVGRAEVLARQETTVLSGLTPGSRVAVSISGPRGSGTSAVAAHLVGAVTSRLTRPGSRGAPLLLRADVSACRTPSALATALFREIDPTFIGRGASTEFLTLLLLRRIRTVGRTVILWFDQVPSKPAELGRVLGPLRDPSRLLPEGPEGLPTTLVLTSGASDPFPEAVQALRTALPPLPGRDLCRAIMARASAVFAIPPSLEAVRALADLSVARGWGLSMVGEMLKEAGRRAEARGGRRLEVEDVALPADLPRHSSDAEGFEASLLEVLRGVRGGIPVGELRERVATRCKERGAPGPGHARLWRHLVALERKGFARRDLRMGGAGGTRAEVSLLREETSAERPMGAPRLK